MASIWITWGLILGFAGYLFYCWWSTRHESGAPRADQSAEEVHFNLHLYTHAKQFCEHPHRR